MTGTLTRYGNILDEMNRNEKWSYDFGLYKHGKGAKKREFSVKIVFGVVVVCCCVVGAFLMTILLTQPREDRQPQRADPLPAPPTPHTSPEPATPNSTLEEPPHRNTLADLDKLPLPDTLHNVRRKDLPEATAPSRRRTHGSPGPVPSRRPFPYGVREVLEYIAANRARESSRVNRDFFDPPFARDPFFRFRPRDPGEVNLLEEQGSERVEERAPLTVTLNVYPMVEGGGRAGRVNATGAAKREKPKRMVIHLNLFSEPPDGVEGRKRKAVV